MKSEITTNDQQITIYTDINIVNAIFMVLRVPPTATVSCKIGQQITYGTPKQIVERLQGILYNVCRAEGFEGC